MTPLDKADVLYQELVHHYEGAKDAEVRAAGKLLLVALSNLQQNSPDNWAQIVREYTDILSTDPPRFRRILQANRSEYNEEVLVIKIRKTHNDNPSH